MPIKAKEEKVIAATEAKTFPDIWLHTWVFNKTSPNDQGWFRVDKKYYNVETGEILDGPEGEAERLYYDNLDEIIQNVPEAAAAYTALLAAVEPIEAYLDAKNAPVEEEVLPEEEVV